MSYGSDRQFSDRFIPQIKRIVGPRLLTPATLTVDQQQATDMVVLTGRDKSIACRIRRPGFAQLYGNQFTIRSHRVTGATTELEKIENGFGDWMLYGHADATLQRIEYWMLICLSAFRAHLIRHRNQIRWGEKPNGDGTFFTWFDVTTFLPSPKLVIARYLPADEICPVVIA